MTELKPCPCCGAEAKLEISITNVTIKCTECVIRAIVLITVRDDPDVFYFKLSARDQWNRRV